MGTGVGTASAIAVEAAALQMSRLDAASMEKLVSLVAELQQQHRAQRERVAPADMLAQVKLRDSAFDAVSVRQVRRAISAANNPASSQVGSSMEIEQTFERMRSCPEWCSSVRSRRQTGWNIWNA